MKHTFRLTTLLSAVTLATVVGLTSCNKKKEMTLPQEVAAGIKDKDNGGKKTPDTDNDTTSAPQTPHCEGVTANLYAGQHYLAGTVAVSNDSANIYVTVTTQDGWSLKRTHLYVGPKSGLPAGQDGNPKIGRFPYTALHDPFVSTYSYTIPLASVGDGSCIIVALHAEAVKLDENGTQIQAETAWGAGKQISSGGSWASYFDYCLCISTSGGGNDGGNDGGIGGN